MSENGTPARPRQLTVASAFVIGGSLILLAAVFDTITNLHSVDTRNEVTKLVSSQTGTGLGLTVSDVLAGMRVGLTVSAVSAVVAAVLGVFVLQRHRGARVALTVVAVPILVTSPLTGGVLGVLVVLAILTLWNGPARDWFAGRTVREVAAPATPRRDSPPPPPAGPLAPPEDRPAQPSQPAQSAPDLSTERPSSLPAATPGYGQPPAQPWTPPIGQPLAWNQVVGAADTGAMPPMVKLACLLTWAFSGVVALVYAVLLVVLIVARHDLVHFVVSSPEWKQAKLQSDLILPVLWLGCLMFLGWSVGSLVLAWFTWRRHNWARYLLAASAAAAVIAALFAFPFGLPHQVACVVAITGLFNTRARAWFAAPSSPYPPQGPYSGPPAGPPYAGPPPQPPSGKPPVW